MSGTLTADLSLLDGMAFRATSGSGHSMIMDAKPAAGGADRGPLPMEAVLEALGGCTGMDVIGILRKKRQDVTGYELRVTGERVDSQPAVFSTITVRPTLARSSAVTLWISAHCSPWAPGGVSQRTCQSLWTDLTAPCAAAGPTDAAMMVTAIAAKSDFRACENILRPDRSIALAPRTWCRP